jgi:hypothetical protein
MQCMCLESQRRVLDEDIVDSEAIVVTMRG